MHLNKTSWVRSWNDDTGKQELNGTIDIDGIDPDKVTFVIEKIGYWRKANAIHRWFVSHVQDGVDDCKTYPVTVNQLQELMETVTTVHCHPQLAMELLPTQEGFFFGSTDYDDGYFHDLEETSRILSRALADCEESEFSYHASW